MYKNHYTTKELISHLRNMQHMINKLGGLITKDEVDMTWEIIFRLAAIKE